MAWGGATRRRPERTSDRVEDPLAVALELLGRDLPGATELLELGNAVGRVSPSTTAPRSASFIPTPRGCRSPVARCRCPRWPWPRRPGHQARASARRRVRGAG